MPSTRIYINLGIGIAVTSLISFLVILLFFPRLHFQLLSGLPEVTTSLHSSARNLPVIFAGNVMDASDGPLLYAHGFFLLSTPIWMLALLITGMVFLARSLLLESKNVTASYLLKLFFLAIAAFPWTYILVTHPALHDGCRHMLFAFPPLFVIMGNAVDSILDKLNTAYPARTLKLAYAVIGLCVLFQVVSLYRMHPYQYVSFNMLAGNRSTLPNRFETEYWCTSNKHMIEALEKIVGPVQPGETIKVRASGARDSIDLFIPNGFELVESIEDADYYLANTYLRSDLLAEGKVIYTIARDSIPIAVIKKLR